MNENCLFCRIVRKEIPARIVAESDTILVFADVSPQAPIHLLAIPKRHITSLAETNDSALVGELITQLTAVAAREGFSSAGYRVVINTNEDGGQSVPHLHAHLLAGRKLTWPPG